MRMAEQSPQVIEASTRLLELTRAGKVGKLAESSDLESFSPFTMALQPFTIPQNSYERMQELALLWQKITHRASQDSSFILDTYKDIKNDPILNPFIQVYQSIIQEGRLAGGEGSQQGHPLREKVAMELFRTDFFLTNDQVNNIKLIEYNSVSVSMSGISQNFSRCQEEMWGNKRSIAPNHSLQTFTQPIIKAYREHKLRGLLALVVQEGQVNHWDQQFIIDTLNDSMPIEVVRIHMPTLGEQVYVGADGDLFHRSGKKIDMVYYRAGYSSREQISWEGLRKCNISKAINIPSLSGFLINTKRMQAELSREEVMLKYLTPSEASTLLTSVIEGWTVGDEDGRAYCLDIMEKEGADGFILKPNQEGGRNNYFGSEAYDKLKTLGREDLPNFILVRKIYPQEQDNYLVGSSSVGPGTKVVLDSEISIYGSVYECPGSPENPQNKVDGYLVRSKLKGVNEGGLMSGTGILGSLQVLPSHE